MLANAYYDTDINTVISDKKIANSEQRAASSKQQAANNKQQFKSSNIPRLLLFVLCRFDIF
jgi:hypothetical protein